MAALNLYIHYINKCCLSRFNTVLGRSALSPVEQRRAIWSLQLGWNHLGTVDYCLTASFHHNPGLVQGEEGGEVLQQRPHSLLHPAL